MTYIWRFKISFGLSSRIIDSKQRNKIIFPYTRKNNVLLVKPVAFIFKTGVCVSMQGHIYFVYSDVYYLYIVKMVLYLLV